MDRWDTCPDCDGKGLVPKASTRRGQRPRAAVRGGERWPTGQACPTCVRSRHIPVLTISGSIPDLIFDANDATIVDLASKRRIDAGATPFSVTASA